jgi:50S ribosomal protein L16 3-hydroxylase
MDLHGFDDATAGSLTHNMPTMSRGLRLLGGLTTEAFVRRHWQRKPLLVRDTGERAFIDQRGLFALAAHRDVESRLVVRQGRTWTLEHGPVAARQRPPLAQPGWTLLVQGVDLHVQAAHELLHRFAFLSWARLDDVMVSFATDGGGVGAHVDAYDVFLLQLEGRRRWRLEPPRSLRSLPPKGTVSAFGRPGATDGPVEAPRWQQGVPLKLLSKFTPVDEWVLEPGDMLYVPPGWGHDGEGVGPRCMTASVGFRAPAADELVRELLPRIADAVDDADVDGEVRAVRFGETPDQRFTATQAMRFRDPRGGPSSAPGRIDPALATFTKHHLRRALDNDDRIALALGEWLTEPKPRVWFDAAARDTQADGWRRTGLELDRRSRMLYNERAVFLNGESYLMKGRDATLLRQLADHRRLGPSACRGFGKQARDTVDEWVAAGWVVPAPATAAQTASSATSPARAERRR